MLNAELNSQPGNTPYQDVVHIFDSNISLIYFLALKSSLKEEERNGPVTLEDVTTHDANYIPSIIIGLSDSLVYRENSSSKYR